MPTLPLIVAILAISVIIALLAFLAYFLTQVLTLISGRMEDLPKAPRYRTEPLKARPAPRAETEPAPTTNPTFVADPVEPPDSTPAPPPPVASLRYLDDAAPNLLPWPPQPLTSLASHIRLSEATRNGERLFFRGHLGHATEDAAWLAFEMNNQPDDQRISLQTHQRRIELRFLDRDQADAQTHDGRPIGTLNRARAIIELVSPDGFAIGDYQLAAKPTVLPDLPSSAQPYYGPLRIGNNLLIEINSNLVTPRTTLTERLPAPPLLSNPPLSLTTDQEDWLLTLIAWQVFQSLYRDRKQLPV